MFFKILFFFVWQMHIFRIQSSQTLTQSADVILIIFSLIMWYKNMSYDQRQKSSKVWYYILFIAPAMIFVRYVS